MKKNIFLIGFMLITLGLFSQETEKISRYYFDEFATGFIYFSDEKPSTGSMNYNYEAQQIQFIVDGKLYNFNKTPNVTHAEIGGIVFVPVANGFATAVYDGVVTLLMSKHYYSEEVQKDGYGNPLSTASVENKDSYSSTSSTANITYLNVERNYKTKITYFLMKDKKVYPATKSGFNKCFPDKKEDIKTFFKTKSSVRDEGIQLKTFVSKLLEK